MITTNDLVSHFSDLLDQLKKNELSSEKVRDLTLLYVKHKKETYDMENKDKAENEKEDELKYFALGWYIHNFLIKNPINK